MASRLGSCKTLRLLGAGALAIAIPAVLGACSKQSVETESRVATSAQAPSAAPQPPNPWSFANPMRVLTVRSLDVARKFAQEPPENRQLARGQRHTCGKDGAELAPLLVTTYGETGVVATWQAYPLALEAWRCPKCEDITYPAFLEAAEATQLVNDAAVLGRSGKLDDAEFMLRRVVGSWSNDSTARMNLGSVYLDRARQAEKSGAPPEAGMRHRKTALAHFEKALTGEPAPTAQLFFMMGNAYLRIGDHERGRKHLQTYLASPAAQEPFITEARRLLAQSFDTRGAP